MPARYWRTSTPRTSTPRATANRDRQPRPAIRRASTEPVLSEGPLAKIRAFCSAATRTSLTLPFPDSVAAAVKSEDAAVREAIGDLRAQLVAGRAPDHGDAGIRLDVPGRRSRPAWLRGERWDRARQGAGVEPFADPLCAGVLIHVSSPPCPVRRACSSCARPR